MTDLNIPELRKLALAATEEPWFASKPFRNDDDLVSLSIGPYELADNKPLHYEDTICEVWDGEHDGAANAALIVALRNNIDELLRLAEIGQRVETAPPVDGAA